MSYIIQIVDLKTQPVAEASVEDFVSLVECTMVCDYMECRRNKTFNVVFKYEEGQEVISFSDLTQEQVLQWVIGEYGQDKINQMYDALKEECRAISEGTVQDSGSPQSRRAPWVNAEDI